MKKIVYSLLGKEISTDILLNLLCGYCEQSKEALSNILNFKVIQSTTSEGSTYKGIIDLNGESLTVNLDCSYDGKESTYILTDCTN